MQTVAPEIELDELCDFIEMNKVIPIIGFDLFNSVFENQAEDLLSFLVEAYNKDLCDNVRKNMTVKSGFDLVNGVYHQLSSRQKITFGRAISNKIAGFRKKTDPVPVCFEQLARIKNFRFYINATFFNSLELAVSTFKVPKAKNESDVPYDVVNYHPRELRDIEYNNTEDDFFTTNFKKPTIYNLLGTHDISEGEYVLTDVHYMELLVKMISNEKNRFSNLKAALKGASLLFIGCDFPDWVLRFFLRFCVDAKMDSKEDLEKNYIIEQLTDEPSKAFLIGSYGITKFKLKPDVFIGKLYRALAERKPNNIEKSFYNNHVFISYNHEDKEIAQQINRQLKDSFIDTWFDETLQSGDELDETIKKAIDNGCAFIPVVTNNVNKEVNIKKYYKKEWNYAIGSKDLRAVFPVVINDYNGHTLLSDVFTQEVRDSILSDSNIFMKREQVASPAYQLSRHFIDELKQLQYNARISGLPNI